MIYLNGHKIEFSAFPNGETKINEDQIKSYLNYHEDKVVFKYENDSDLIKLMLFKKYLDDRKARNTTLTISYMPYSRMDRTQGDSAFTLKFVCDFINNLMFECVRVVEPHSDVTMALLDRSESVFPTIDLLDKVLTKIQFDKKEDYLFYPDAGAQKRYHALKGFKNAVGYKKRDFETGKINELQIIGDVEDLKERKVLILDDLCSYGGTFELSASKLKEKGAKEVFLFVTHCEESIFKGVIFKNENISKVFTTNTIINDSPNTRVFSGQIEVIDILTNI